MYHVTRVIGSIMLCIQDFYILFMSLKSRADAKNQGVLNAVHGLCTIIVLAIERKYASRTLLVVYNYNNSITGNCYHDDGHYFIA